MRRDARVDVNQPNIVKGLRSLGATVLITSQLKNAFDILVGYKGKLHIMEIKDPEKSPSKRRLSEGEDKCKKAFEKVGVPYNVVLSLDDAMKVIGER